MADSSPSFPALAKVVRVHSGEEFEADDFPTLKDGKLAAADLERAEAIVQAASALSHFLENEKEKETFEPPSDLLHQYAALETHADYDREEELSLELWKAIYQ